MLEKVGEIKDMNNYVDIYVNLESSYPEELAMPVRDGEKLNMTLIISEG